MTQALPVRSLLTLTYVALLASCDSPEKIGTAHAHLHADDKPLDPDQFELPTRTGYFMEVDGRDPETPACHPFYTSDLGCDADTRDRSGDIWEQCEDGDSLIETGPSAGECHMHAFGVGHPYRVSCSAYCDWMYGAWGVCVTTPMDCGENGNKAIGYCDCINICDPGDDGDGGAAASCPVIEVVGAE